MKKRSTISIGFILLILSISTIKADTYSLNGGFVDISNNPQTFANYEGTVLLVDATASWCVACDLMLQNLNKVYDSVDNRVTIITLSVDLNDELSQVAELKTRYDSKWIFGKDAQVDFVDQYEVINVPTLFLFAEDGSIFKKWVGITNPDIILDAINEHFEVPFEAAFDTGSSARVGSLFEDLFSNNVFRMVSLLLVVLIVYLKISPSAPNGTEKNKSSS